MCFVRNWLHITSSDPEGQATNLMLSKDIMCLPLYRNALVKWYKAQSSVSKSFLLIFSNAIRLNPADLNHTGS